MLPLIFRSDERTEGAGFAEVGVFTVSLGLGFGVGGCGAACVSFSAALLPGSLILDLENILSCLDEGHRIDGVAASPDFVV